MARPEKIKHPVGLDEFLRRLFPKKRPELRQKIFREWRRTILTAEYKRAATDQEVDAELKLFREGKLSAAFYKFGFADSLNDYVPVYLQEIRVKKASNAATARWSEEK